MSAETDANPQRRPRSDALRNRRLVSDAAVEVFAERGLDATAAEIARRAKVGKATVFRHFATKDELVVEVARRWLEEWGETLRVRMLDADGETLRTLIDDVFPRLHQDRFTLDILRSGPTDESLTAARSKVERLFTAAIDRARGAGVVSPHVTYADLSVLILGACGQLADIEIAEPSVHQRFADYVWAAIRAPSA